MAAVAPIVGGLITKGIGNAVLRFALSLAISYITQKVFGPDLPGGGAGSARDPGVKQRIPADPSNKLPVVYGEDKIFGSIVYADITQDNQTMAFIIALCEGPINNIGDVYWDDYKLTLDSTGTVTSALHADGINTDDWLNGNLKIIKFPDGGRCGPMESFSGKWNGNKENRQMPDVAYVYAELKYDREENVTGLTSKLGFEIQGKLVRTIVNANTLAGPPPRPEPLRDTINLDIFDRNLSFSDFQGNQLKYYSTSGIFPSSAIGSSHTKVHVNGTLQIVDLGDDPNTGQPASVTAYINGTGGAYGSGVNGSAELVFVEPGEHHTSSHSSNTTTYTYWQPSGYTNPATGVSYPDDGYRIINGLKIKNWGNNYSVSDASTGSNQFRVWGIYTYTDYLGVTGTFYFPIVTYNFNTGSTDEQKRDNLLNNFSFAYTSDPYNYGYRRKATASTDSYGNIYQGVYQEHQQWFTAKLPYVVGEAARGYYSSNPAECLLDYLTNKIYGCGLSIEDSDIDLETFYNHKVFCDTLVTHNDPDGNSVTSKRYQCNGFINTNDSKDLNISDIVSNSQSIFSYTLGKFQMISDTTGSPVMNFDDTNIYGDVSILEDGFNSNLNEMTLKFKSKSEKYQDDQVFIDYPDKYFNEPILSKDLDLKFINTNVEAQRLGTVLMNKSRSSKIISFKTDTRAVSLQVNDVIRVYNTYYDLDTPRKLNANLTNTSNQGTSPANAKGQIKFIDNTESKDVKYMDGTDAIVTFPYNVATFDQLFTFFKDCIISQYEDTSGTLTKEELDQNNKLGQLVSLVELNTAFTTGGDYGGGFIFTLNHISFVPKNNPNNIAIQNITSIDSTTWNVGVIDNGSRSGTQYKVNSISETELQGGVQGYNLTAQEYNPDDYVVATLTAKADAPQLNPSRGFLNLGVATNLTLNSLNTSASIPNVDVSITLPNSANVEGLEFYYSDTVTGTKYLTGLFTAPAGTYAANSVETFALQGIPTTADLYIWVKCTNSFGKGAYSSGLSCGAWNPVNASTNVGTNSVSTTSIQTGAVGTNQLANTLDLSAKTVVLADNMKNTPSFEAYLSADQTITSGTETKLEIDTEDFDDGSSYDNATDFRFLPTTAGKYYVYAQTQINSSDDFDGSALIIKKNGSAVATHAKRHEDNEYYNVSKIIQLNGTTDYVEVFGYQNSGSDKDFSGGASKTYFGAYKLIN